MLPLTSNAVMLAGVFGGWEVVLILAVILILLGAKRLPEIGKGLGAGLLHFRKEIDSQAYDAGKSLGGIYGKPAAEALTPDNQTAELYDPAVFQGAKGIVAAGKRSGSADGGHSYGCFGMVFSIG